MKKLVYVLILAMLLTILGGCGELDISDYADSQILITGLLEEDFYITPEQLMELECVSETAQGKSAKAGTVKAYGPTLETFLESYGKTLDEFRSVKLIASDDYTVTLGRVTWEKYDIILSIGNGSKALDDYQQPLRVVIPGGDSGNWARMVVEIQFTYQDSGVSA